MTMCPLSIHVPVKSVDDWFRLALPKRVKVQWKDGRSAKELARAWFTTGEARVPRELVTLFQSHPAMGTLVLEAGIPEVETGLDNYGGEGRHHDLILLGQAGGVRTLVTIEAKADEEFGPVIEDYLAEKAGTSSNVPARIDLLCRSIFGRPVYEELGQLRYQLLHGVAGTLIEAENQGAAQAVFVVHEFLSDQTKPDKVERNRRDLDRFVHQLPGFRDACLEPGQLLGPIQVPGGEFVPSDIPLFIGKVTTQLT